MFGFIAAFGAAARALDEATLRAAWPDAAAVAESTSPSTEVRLARFQPQGGPEIPGFVRSADGQVLVYVDGYLYTADAPRTAGREAQIRAFADACSRDGFEAAFGRLQGGTFNLVVVDLARRTAHASTDHVGALPLYVAPTAGGVLVSNNPVALARTGLPDLRPDLTGMAEWAYIGYTLGDRFLVKGIRIVAPCTAVRWREGATTHELVEHPASPWRLLPEKGRAPGPGDLADAFIEACARIALIDPAPAQFQSAGKDSRLILAAWPAGTNPPCYTYGEPTSHEVALARQLAELRGSTWKHLWIDGQELAPLLPRLFDCTGLYVYPDRYFSARAIRGDGHRGVLDGYLAGATIGASFLDSDKYFSRLTRFLRLFTIYRDQRVSAIGTGPITDAILDSFLDVRDEASFRLFLDEDFVQALIAEKPAIRADLAAQVERFRPANDSLGALWTNVVLANRSVHSICQQMLIVRSHLDVYCPFSGDVAMARLQWQLPPEQAAYKRLYIRMYRERFPDYGAVPYGATLLPLVRSPLHHKLASILMSRGIIIPGLTGDPRGRPRDATGWATWLRTSPALRDEAARLLDAGSIGDRQRTETTFAAVAAGQRAATGKIFHYAAMSRWLGMAA